jgi:hypothetical protein
MLRHLRGARSLGDPVACWADTLIERLAPQQPIALLVAPGFLEDMQVVSYLRKHIEARGARAVLGNARHLRADRSGIRFSGPTYDGTVAAVVRFYQAEWLAELRDFPAFRGLFEGAVPVTNPGAAALTESKRLPLVWDRLRATTSAFHRAMPETRDARAAPWLLEPDEWVIKGAYSNTGDLVLLPHRMTRAARIALAARVFAEPTRWVAQRRFHVAPIDAPSEAVRACLGVYTVDGRVAGAYARIATGEVVDGAAIDVACLLEEVA